MIPLLTRAEQQRQRTAIVTAAGAFSYQQLLDASAAVATRLLDGRPDLDETRVAFLAPPGFEYVAVQWGIWRAGGVAVPLGLQHPPPELEYTIGDAGAKILVADPEFADRLRPIAEAKDLRLLTSETTSAVAPDVRRGRSASPPT